MFLQNGGRKNYFVKFIMRLCLVFFLSISTIFAFWAIVPFKTPNSALPELDLNLNFSLFRTLFADVLSKISCSSSRGTSKNCILYFSLRNLSPSPTLFFAINIPVIICISCCVQLACECNYFITPCPCHTIDRYRQL